MLRAITAVAATLMALLATAVIPAGVMAAETAPDYNAIDRYVSSSLAGSPGIALAIVHGDQVVHVKGFGAADGSGRPVTADTPFVIGSQSKSFTALGIMQLSERGSLDLDAPIQRYLPWFRVADAGYSARITIRQLLNQTSGLPPSAPFDSQVTTFEQRVRDLATVHLTSAPGRAFAYSNPNYDALGSVIEAVSGLPYGDYVAQNIFAPLGMTNSFASEAAAQAHGLATGHQWWYGLAAPTDTYRADYVPAGYLISSVSDMSHYLIAQLQGGVYNGYRVLSPAGIAQMHTGVAKVSTGGFYGMGWEQGELNGTTVVSHDGDSLNMHSDMMLVPSAGWGVELIINSDSIPLLLTASVEATAKGVISMLLGSAVPPTVSPAATYLVFDAVVLVLVAFQLWSVVRASRSRVRRSVGWRSGLRHLVLPAAWRGALALVAIGLIGLFSQQVGSSYQSIAGTDFGIALLVIAALLIVNSVVRVARYVGAPRPAGQAGLATTSVKGAIAAASHRVGG